MKQEYLARAIVFTLTAAVIAALVFGYKNSASGLVLTGHMPEQGGWLPDTISARVGQPLHLRLTSADVVHGFAIGQMDGAETEVLPGKFSDLEIIFDKPGIYTYYCTRWCGPNHWRMRGTIEVEGDLPGQAPATKIPLYTQLGIDIDADHPAAFIPHIKPSAQNGKALSTVLLENDLMPMVIKAKSPSQVFEELRSVESLNQISDEQLWDLVAYLFWKNTSQAQLEKSQQLYTKNCAACHGPSGQGDGVFANADPYLSSPADFTDSTQMLGASPALLQGKIIRGGMGSGMPYWGTIFTEDQTWSLVDYLWSFQFDYSID